MGQVFKGQPFCHVIKCKSDYSAHQTKLNKHLNLQYLIPRHHLHYLIHRKTKINMENGKDPNNPGDGDSMGWWMTAPLTCTQERCRKEGRPGRCLGSRPGGHFHMSPHSRWGPMCSSHAPWSWCSSCRTSVSLQSYPTKAKMGTGLVSMEAGMVQLHERSQKGASKSINPAVLYCILGQRSKTVIFHGIFKPLGLLIKMRLH